MLFSKLFYSISPLRMLELNTQYRLIRGKKVPFSGLSNAWKYFLCYHSVNLCENKRRSSFYLSRNFENKVPKYSCILRVN